MRLKRKIKEKKTEKLTERQEIKKEVTAMFANVKRRVEQEEKEAKERALRTKKRKEEQERRWQAYIDEQPIWIFYVTGHGVPANGEANKKWQDLRESYGLPPLPPTVHTHPEAVEEVQKLLQSVGFTDLMANAKKLKEERAKAEEAEKEE